MRRRYNKNTKIDFGLYNGYDLGIVYVFDPGYIDWCINNIDSFCVVDLTDLNKYSVINPNLDVQYKMIGDPSAINGIDIFDTFEELEENLNLGDKKYTFSKETLNLNKNRI